MFKKYLRIAHLWLGLASGLVVFILGVTGCLYVFEEELRPIIYADHYRVQETKKEPLLVSDLLKTAESALGNKAPVSSIVVYNSKDRSYMFRSFADKPVENKLWYWEGIEDRQDAFVDPYTGEVLKIKNSEFEFFRVVMWFHWSLLLKTEIGQPIVGIATIVFVISLITGLVLWWPKNKSAAKQRFWFRWKAGTKWKRKNYDLHNILGYYMMVFALIISLTGLVWAFDWFENSVSWIANGGRTIESVEEIISSDTANFTSNRPVDLVFEQTQKLYPNAVRYLISLPKDSLSAQAVHIKFSSRFDDTTIYFDRYTGEQLKTIGWNDKNNGEKMNFLNYDIHLGSILGFPGKVLAFLASLVSASLPVTGFLIWWGRKKKVKK
ncbi:putative iron-regulated membrane protein [Algoriphagus sp. 4150]|uniref:PepSY-associated TM helix domain-containing protein n=1 Tax=Algoriphagus sp. 4150 TaxID=2817756 RepID=UPI00286419EA|nr:PepSY-associated TM helix domain-containing protein [Algoriphagus sp. 4150]MDR7129534.1 putative iron-regulated membrane protein [Algoriphagus sp. 4150]